MFALNKREKLPLQIQLKSTCSIVRTFIPNALFSRARLYTAVDRLQLKN